MGRANVQVVSTRAGLHSLAHRYGRTISVFTKVSSSDRIILNQYSIRGDALWYALPVAQRLIAEGAFKSWQSRRPTKEICSFGRMVNHWRPGLFYTHGAISQSPTGQSLFTIDRVGLFPTRKSFVLFSQSQPSLTAICRRDP